MIPLYTEEEFNSAKSKDNLPCKCIVCTKPFYRTKREIQLFLSPNHKSKGNCCSKECKYINDIKKQKVVCLNCNTIFEKPLNQIKKSPNHFCCHSCNATYNNTHKKTGTRRSKLESWIEDQLISLYPETEFHFNRKDTINSELDIYIPSKKLAFELNGIFHYEPIYGLSKLNQIQNNDDRKFQACLEQGIELCIIDASAMKNFKLVKAKKYLDIIIEILEKSERESNPCFISFAD